MLYVSIVALTQSWRQVVLNHVKSASKVTAVSSNPALSADKLLKNFRKHMYIVGLEIKISFQLAQEHPYFVKKMAEKTEVKERKQALQSCCELLIQKI